MNNIKHLDKQEEKIAGMFDSIAESYDSLNHILSFNIDKRWRRKMINLFSANVPKDGKIVDIACGTGDMTILLHKDGYNVKGLDISQKMLEIARSKSSDSDIEFGYGSAENLPYGDREIKGVTISFGIRNFNNRGKCIEEIYRILDNEGILAIIEFSIPENIVWRFIYSLYFKYVLPFVGGVFTKGARESYRYLPLSTYDFPHREEFCEELKKGGFREVSAKKLTGGVAVICLAKK